MSLVFKGKKVADKQKLRGGYYTPQKLSAFLCEWAIRNTDENILEPSCGDGNFVLEAINIASASKIKRFRLTAVEIDPEEIDKAKQRVKKCSKLGTKVSWINDDFFKAYEGLRAESFSAVVGNPPFIRFQYFDDESRECAFSHLRNAGYRPTKLANCWAAFIQLSIELLQPGGRLAMVVPAELLQVKYAAELRERVTRSFEHVVLVTFKKLVFPDIQQEVVLLLAEGKRGSLESECDVHTVEVDDGNSLSPALLNDVIAHSKVKHARPGLKWTSLFLKDEVFKAIDAAQKTPNLKHLGDFASVDVGIVTGRNSFFVLTEEAAVENDLQAFTIPLVGKTNALRSIDFCERQYREFAKKQPSSLLSLAGIENSSFTDGLKDYIQQGEAEGVHLGYKCRIRKRWYDVPSAHVSDGFLFRQIHRFPLLVKNSAGAACTDTIHRVQLRDPDIDIGQLCGAFINSLTFAWSEVCGRSYGGGVLELEPNEAEELPVPFSKGIELDLNRIDGHLKLDQISEALDYVDEVLLIGHLGMSRRRVNLLRAAWTALRDRRIGRR